MLTYKILTWDSDFFGFNVARIEGSYHSGTDLSKILDDLKMLGVTLAYWSRDPVCELSNADAIKNDGKLVDRRAVFQGNTSSLENTSRELIDIVIKSVGADFDAKKIESLAIQAGSFSRFKLDAMIPGEKFQELFKLWAINSVSRQIADECFIATVGDHICGLITVSARNGVATIGLIAVSETSRGKKIGSHLVLRVADWATDRGIFSVEVVTQLNNVPACEFYTKSGFQLSSVSNTYHFWF